MRSDLRVARSRSRSLLSALDTGAQEQPGRLADIHPGAASSAPGDAVGVDATVFFVAEDPVNGRELWKTDGTPEGTVLVADIRPGPASSNPRMLRRLASNVVFVADDGATGQELWRSNGTPAGTVRVRDIVAGPEGSLIEGLTPIHASLAVFKACDSASGCEVWRTDGSSAALVRNIEPGPHLASPRLSPSSVAACTSRRTRGRTGPSCGGRMGPFPAR